MKDCKVLSISSAKGGVGKTTTCANLGAALAMRGNCVLLIDNDPQGDLTKVMGVDPAAQRYTLANLLNAALDDNDLDDIFSRCVHQVNELYFIPANSRLAGVASRLTAMQISSVNNALDAEYVSCERVLQKALAPLRERYDYIIIDCGHSMDLLTVNALVAADQAIVPVQAHYLAQEDMRATLNVIQRIQQELNPGLSIGGILLTMYQGRTNLCRSIQEEIQTVYGSTFTVFAEPIDYSIRVAEHPISTSSIFEYEPENPAAVAYAAMAREVITHGAG